MSGAEHLDTTRHWENPKTVKILGDTRIGGSQMDVEYLKKQDLRGGWAGKGEGVAVAEGHDAGAVEEEEQCGAREVLCGAHEGCLAIRTEDRQRGRRHRQVVEHVPRVRARP
eukprot:294304-Pyramimonas_sp.AAC.3